MLVNGQPLPSDPRYRVSRDGVVYGPKAGVLKPWIQNGYQKVSIGQKRRYVHDLVLETFVGPKPSGAVVRHGQLGPLNNSIENICYGTYSENEYDKIRDGTHPQANKTHCPKGHELTFENTMLYLNRGWRERRCRTCENARTRDYKRRKRQEMASCL